MSMPNFPEDVLDISCEQALNMLLGSIAMEELALSHIMNAEGEKLQYVLGTLPCKPCGCTSPKEVLEVNRSISDLLEKVAYNQILLKGKLRDVLDAKDLCCPPGPSCPPTPPEPPCPPHSERPCVLTSARDVVWTTVRPLPWKKLCACESMICWQGCSQSLIHLFTQYTYLISFSLRVRTCEPGMVRAALQEVNGCSCEDILVCEGCAAPSDLVAHLSGCTVLSADTCKAVPQTIQLSLKMPDSVVVEQATLQLVAI